MRITGCSGLSWKFSQTGEGQKMWCGHCVKNSINHIIRYVCMCAHNEESLASNAFWMYTLHPHQRNNSI